VHFSTRYESIVVSCIIWLPAISIPSTSIRFDGRPSAIYISTSSYVSSPLKLLEKDLNFAQAAIVEEKVVDEEDNE
jgi:hypothetical protein